MRDYLNKLRAGNDLTFDESYTLFLEMATYSVHHQALVLKAFAKKKETADELLGAMQAFLEHSDYIDYPDSVIDIVGTGGDGLKTFNISTAASLVVASCGVTVAKHGGKCVTSLSGSTDVLTALNVSMPNTADASITALKRHGYAYLRAPLFNRLLSAFSDVRRQLKIPTILNTVGPLINPIRPKRQVLGVYRADLLPIMAHVLNDSGLDHALIVHSDDGLDEFSISAPSQVIELRNGVIDTYQITPEDVGLKTAPLQDVVGGNSAENARIICDIFSGKTHDAKLDIVLFNSAAALFVANHVATLKEGVDRARSAIASGATAQFLYTLQNTSIKESL